MAGGPSWNLVDTLQSAYRLISRPPEGPRHPKLPATRSRETRARSGTETLPIQKCIIPVHPYARCGPLSTHLASASDGQSRGANEVYRTPQIRTTRRKRGVIRSDSTHAVIRAWRLAFTFQWTRPAALRGDLATRLRAS